MASLLQGQKTIRGTLVEYSAPVPLVQSLASDLGIERARVRDQLLVAGERVARILHLSDSPIEVGSVGLRARDVAGLLRVSPRLELEIAPKFLGAVWESWREDFFFLATLSRHGRLLTDERIGSTVGAREDLATLVARAMISMFWANHRRPLRTYRHTRISEFAIDGEVEAESVFSPEPEGYDQRAVTYDRRNVFNSAIMSAARALLPDVHEPQTRRQLERISYALAPQGVIRRGRHRQMPSRAKRWQPLHDLAIDVLSGFGVAYDAAEIHSPGFVVDTWRIWEDLVTLALRLSWGAVRVSGQRSATLGLRTSFDRIGRATSRKVSVTPDVTVGGGAGLLVDAKYKGRIGDVRNRIAEADLYEALAFATATKGSRVVLLYPSPARSVGEPSTGATVIFERINVGDVLVIGMETEVRGISRVGGFRRFADRLVGALRQFAGREVAA